MGNDMEQEQINNNGETEKTSWTPENISESTLSIKIGNTSIDAHGIPAVAIANLFPEYIPKILEAVNDKKAEEFLKGLFEFGGWFFNKLNTPSASTPGKAVPTDGEVSGNNDVSGNGSGAA